MLTMFVGKCPKCGYGNSVYGFYTEKYGDGKGLVMDGYCLHCLTDLSGYRIEFIDHFPQK